MKRFLRCHVKVKMASLCQLICLQFLCSPSFALAPMCTVRFIELFSITTTTPAFLPDRFPAPTTTPACKTDHFLALTVILAKLLGLVFCVFVTSLIARAMEGREEQAMCINCNISMTSVATQNKFLVLEQNTRVISLISNWISPVIVTEEDYICEACFSLAVQAVNAELHQNNDRCAGPSRRGHTEVCLVCGRSLTKRQSHQILHVTSRHQSDIVQMVQDTIAPREIQISDRVCHTCFVRLERRAIRQNEHDERRVTEDSVLQELTEPEVLENPEQTSIPAVTPNENEMPEARPDLPNATLRNYRRAPNTASHCIFYGCDNIFHLHTVSNPLRRTLLINHKYYVPKHGKVCSQHLQQNSWHLLYDAENSMSTFTIEQIEHMLSFVDVAKPFFDFSSMISVEDIDDHLYKYWMGISKENFKNILHDTPRILEAHRGILGLACILIKMRTGDSDERIATLLQIPRQTIERKMAVVREILLQDFVPRNLGLNHKTREETLQHNLLIPNGLHNEDNMQCVIICDGTYIYLNKSSNYMFQKDSYSLHKYRNLLKPFMLVLCDGYILDCFGPFKATTSDADIMKHLFQNEDSPLRQYFCANDVFILDRGFRDCIDMLRNECNYQVRVPESLLEGEHQLTTIQANRSRCVTICRWVVEVVNGYFKRDFRLLRFDYFNKTAPNMMIYFQIAAALINKFGVRLHDRVDAAQILSIIRERMFFENNLSIAVNALNMNRRASSFRSITAGDGEILFPRLEYTDLILFALGTYQIRQARSYYGEHIRFHGGYRIEVCREIMNLQEFNLRGSGENSLIRGKIKSRHVGRRQYYVYILIENEMNGREAIPEYCCTCIVGRRTVGCCAHVMTIVWYLGWARYQDNINPPAAFLDDVVIREDLDY